MVIYFLHSHVSMLLYSKRHLKTKTCQTQNQGRKQLATHNDYIQKLSSNSTIQYVQHRKQPKHYPLHSTIVFSPIFKIMHFLDSKLSHVQIFGSHVLCTHLFLIYDYLFIKLYKLYLEIADFRCKEPTVIISLLRSLQCTVE